MYLPEEDRWSPTECRRRAWSHPPSTIHLTVERSMLKGLRPVWKVHGVCVCDEPLTGVLLLPLFSISANDFCKQRNSLYVPTRRQLAGNIQNTMCTLLKQVVHKMPVMRYNETTGIPKMWVDSWQEIAKFIYPMKKNRVASPTFNWDTKKSRFQCIFQCMMQTGTSIYIFTSDMPSV